jgi:hypothetical protein
MAKCPHNRSSRSSEPRFSLLAGLEPQVLKQDPQGSAAGAKRDALVASSASSRSPAAPSVLQIMPRQC